MMGHRTLAYAASIGRGSAGTSHLRMRLHLSSSLRRASARLEGLEDNNKARLSMGRGWPTSHVVSHNPKFKLNF